MTSALSIGDRISLSGGYDYEPRWLSGKSCHQGVISAIIPGQNETPAVVVRLEAPITVDGVTGEFVVLELRYVGAKWKETGTVHLELCDFVPEPKAWQHRRQGKWIESHAIYKQIERHAL